MSFDMLMDNKVKRLNCLFSEFIFATDEESVQVHTLDQNTDIDHMIKGTKISHPHMLFQTSFVVQCYLFVYFLCICF